MIGSCLELGIPPGGISWIVILPSPVSFEIDECIEGLDGAG